MFVFGIDKLSKREYYSKHKESDAYSKPLQQTFNLTT